MRTRLILMKAAGWLLAGGVLCIAGCSKPEPPEQAWMLSWYPYEGTDYGPVVPGFDSLAQCQRAGVSMSIRHLIDTHGVTDAFDYRAVEKPPWFECAQECRSYTEGVFLNTCKTINEFHGEQARSPR